MRAETAAERSHSVSESIEKGLRAASSLGLKTEFSTFGDILLSYRCDLTDAAGNQVSGKGKGIGLQATASALFEAIEHYFLFARLAEITNRLKLGEHPLDAEIIDGSPSFSSHSVERAPSLSRINFRKLNARGIEISVPAFLLDPEFKSEFPDESEYLRRSGLCRYSTNSGTASGTTLEDAQLHALMELIERDALSIELLATVFAPNPRAIRIIARDSIRGDLESVVAVAERETAGIITIWDITSDTQIPAVLVRIVDPSDLRFGYFGSGASLFFDCAIVRALTEAVQGFHIYNYELPRPSLASAGRLHYTSSYRRCLLEYGRFEYGGGEIETSLNLLMKERQLKSNPTVKEQIEITVKALKAADVSVYERSIFSGDVHVAQIYSPKLERFFLASAGVFVTPGSRGLKVVSDSRRQI